MIDKLSLLLTKEIFAANKYLIQSKVLLHMGFSKLAKKEDQEATEEMKHAKMLTERILFLDGMPNISSLSAPIPGNTVEKILESNLKIEKEAIDLYKDAIDFAEKEKDFGTSYLLESLIKSEEEHYLWLKIQFNLINTLGITQYLQTHG
jgi:bacterioferritin